MVGTRSEHLTRNTVWTGSLLRVLCQEHPSDIVSGVVQGPGGGRVGVEQELCGGRGRAGAGECCTDVSKQAKKQLSSSASSALRSPFVASQPLKSCMPRPPMFLLWSTLAFLIPLLRSA